MELSMNRLLISLLALLLVSCQPKTPEERQEEAIAKAYKSCLKSGRESGGTGAWNLYPHLCSDGDIKCQCKRWAPVNWMEYLDEPVN